MCSACFGLLLVSFLSKVVCLRNDPQYPTMGYAPHSGRGVESGNFEETATENDEKTKSKRERGLCAVSEQ